MQERQETDGAGVLKLLLPLLLFVLLLDSVSEWSLVKNNHALTLELGSYQERLPVGHAQFYALYEPSSLEIWVTPQGKDVDLYIVADDDLDHFRHRIPHLEKFINSSLSSFPSKSKTSRLVKLDPPIPWEVISPPEEVKSIHRLVNATVTTYWSFIPTFTLASTSLGVEKLYVPAAFGRPLLVVVFASSGGFVEPDNGVESFGSEEQRYHHYVIQLLKADNEVVSTYETIRNAAERQTFSYDELAAMFSTLHLESQRETKTETEALQKLGIQRNEVVKVEEDGRESSMWGLIQHFVLGLLENLVTNLI